MKTSVKDDFDLVIFLVDDDADDQFIFQQAIGHLSLNIHLHFANNGVEAIERFQNDPGFKPDYVFMDMNMPLMDGRKCISEIHKLKKKANMPIIIHSTANLAEDAASLIEEGASFYFKKPDTIPDFAKVLQRILSAHFLTA